MKYAKYYLISILVIVLDQTVKMLVYFNMDMGLLGEVPIFGDWFKLHYTLNPGMAFGITLGSEYGKLILTSFRLLAMGGIGYYLYYLVEKKMPQGLIWCVALILGGAIGNLIDGVFYGVLLNNAPYEAPSPWFHGQVIDMFYFDIWEGYLPSWIPIFGGQFYSFWPIFNIADASIFCAVTYILIFQKSLFIEEPKIPTTNDAIA
ncbi:MAG: lipoprotein signal peptidase [Cytophagales bacterium]|nr:lipoprotein signal peptidase [Cytophagales bacterium]